MKPPAQCGGPVAGRQEAWLGGGWTQRPKRRSEGCGGHLRAPRPLPPWGAASAPEGPSPVSLDVGWFALTGGGTWWGWTGEQKKFRSPKSRFAKVADRRNNLKNPKPTILGSVDYAVLYSPYKDLKNKTPNPSPELTPRRRLYLLARLGFISCDQEFALLLWQPGISGQVSHPDPVALGWGRECLNLPDA